MDDFFRRVMGGATAWPAGRRDLHWHVLPSKGEARRLTEPYRELTSTPGLVPVPPEWLHITVLHAGPHAETGDAELAALIARVADLAKAVEPFTLTFYPASVGTVALESVARPGAAARQLWELTSCATREVMGTGTHQLFPSSAYYPHLALAYAGSEGHLVDRAALKAALSDVAVDLVTVRCETLWLVSQWHDGRARISWDRVASVPLGRAARG